MTKLVRGAFMAVVAASMVVATPAAAEPLRAGAARIVAQLNRHVAGNTLYEASFRRLETQTDTMRNARQWPLGDSDWDTDPICNCQDQGGPYALEGTAMRPDGQGQIRYRIGGGANDAVYHNSLIVRQVGGRWMITDVISDGRSYRQYLVRANGCLRASRTSEQMERCMARG